MYYPPGSSSWCKLKKAAAEGTLDDFVHENPPLNDKTLEAIKPKNNNESLNSLIWTFAPKHIHAGKKTIEIANYLAVCIFNEGFLPIFKIMGVMGITIGPEAHAFGSKRDETRIRRSEVRVSDASKEARTARLAERSKEEDLFEQEKGPMYGAGIAD